MNVKLQTSGNTRIDRYPGMFEVLRSLVPDTDSMTIVSFGCSTGEELITISKRYHHAKIIGIEIEPKRQQVAVKRVSTIPNISVVGPEQFQCKADAILALSVLCQFPSDRPIPFSDFDITLNSLVSNLKDGGYLFALNTNYHVTDSTASRLLTPLEFPFPWGISVPQFTRGGVIRPLERLFVFQKI